MLELHENVCSNYRFYHPVPWGFEGRTRLGQQGTSTLQSQLPPERPPTPGMACTPTPPRSLGTGRPIAALGQVLAWLLMKATAPLRLRCNRLADKRILISTSRDGVSTARLQVPTQSLASTRAFSILWD